jgi:hypothetical protein
MARFQLRRDSTSNWLAANPVLLEGEQGLDLTTGHMYIGDGISKFTELSPFSGNLADVYTKTEVDDLLGFKAFLTTVYTKDQLYTRAEVDSLLSSNDLSNFYTKTEVDDLLGSKAFITTVYTKNEVYNKDEVYNKSEVYNKYDTYNKTELYHKNRLYTKDEINALVIDDLADVETYFPEENQVLAYDASIGEWTNRELDAISVETLKSIASQANDFDEFKALISAL